MRVQRIIVLVIVFLFCNIFDISETIEENNPDIRKILNNYMSACGPKGFCYPDIYMDQIVSPINEKYCSPCPACFCDEWCHHLGDCCVDIQLNKTYHVNSSEYVELPKFVCTYEPDFESHWINETLKSTLSYPVIITCPNNYSDTEIIKKCENPLADDFIAKVPLTSVLSGLSYRNRYCFICNDAVQPIMWDVKVKRCRKMLEYTLFSSFHEIVENAVNASCKIKFQLNTDLPITRKCHASRLINKCKSSSDIDRDLLWACENVKLKMSKYQNPFCRYCNNMVRFDEVTSRCYQTDIVEETVDEFLIEGCERTSSSNRMTVVPTHKNLYCFLCNTLETGVECKRLESKPRVSLGILFDISDVFGIINLGPGPDEACNLGEIFDSYQQKCRQKFCPLGQRFKEGVCKYVIKGGLHAYGYTLYFRLRSVESMLPASVCNIMEELKSSIHETLEQKLIEDQGNTIYLSFPAFNASVFLSEYNVSLIVRNFDVSDLSHDDIMVKFKLALFAASNRFSLENILIKSREFKYIVRNGTNSTYSFQAYIDDRSYVFSGINFIDSDVCNIRTMDPSVRTTWMPYEEVSDLLVCQQVELAETEFEIWNKYSIFIPVLLEIFEVSKYRLINDRARICVRDYLYPFIGNNTDFKTSQDILSYLTLVSIVCLNLSLFCIALTFLTYCIFPKYQTLPGKLNMFLVAILFFAIALFELSFYITNEHQSLCVVISAWLHYFWLCYFSCMNTCCLHMYRVFCCRIITRESNTAERNRFQRYTVYFTLVPAVVVVITFVVNNVVFDSSGIGSDDQICFFKERILKGVFFVLPISLLTVFNIVLFVCSMRQIYSNPRLPNNTGYQYHVRALTKLFSLTGITWLLQLLDTLLEYTEFSYSAISFLVIVLNTLHGVFIFIAFICNSRVYNSYRDLIQRLRRIYWARRNGTETAPACMRITTQFNVAHAAIETKF